eukprot:725057_1
MSSLDQKNQTPMDWCNYYEYIMTPLYSIAAISLIPPLLSFINAKYQQQLKTHRLFYWFEIIFFTSIVILDALSAVSYRVRCDSNATFKFLNQITASIYAFQCGWLIVLLFGRLVFIFKGTVFSLSKRTIWTCVVCYALWGLMGSFVYIIPASSPFKAVATQNRQKKHCLNAYFTV